MIIEGTVSLNCSVHDFKDCTSVSCKNKLATKQKKKTLMPGKMALMKAIVYNKKDYERVAVYKNGLYRFVPI